MNLARDERCHPWRVDDDLMILPGVVLPAAELEWTFSRSGGPGGQSVNTTDSRVQVTFDLAGSPSVPEHLRQRAIARLGTRLRDGRVTVTASEARSQWQNRQSARRRLAEQLAAAMAPPPRTRRPTRPSRASVERRLQGKKARGLTKRLRRNRDDD